MNKTIILLTNTYPISEKGETFIHGEVEVLSKLVQKIYIIPREGSADRGCDVKLPSNVKIYPLGVMDKGDKVRYFIASPKLVIATLREILKDFKNRKYIIRYAMKALRGTYTVEQLIKEQNLKPSQTILYSYWLHFNALAIALCKCKVFKKISRAHGYDFYKYRSKQVYKEFTMSNIDNVYAASEKAKEYIQSEYGATNVTTTLLGVHNDTPLKEYTKSPQLRLVSCSRMIPLKRINLIVDTLASIDDVNITWVHIGGGEEEDSVKDYAEEKLRDKKNIQHKFNGHLTNNEVFQLYKDDIFDLFVSLSETEGGAPVSMQEAQSYGIPIVATDVGGTSALVNEKTGRLIHTTDEAEIVKETAKAIRNYNDKNIEEIIETREICHTHWQEHFNAQKVYREFYEQLIAESRKWKAESGKLKAKS